MRTRIDRPMPGDIIDGSRVGVPEYWRIDRVSDLAAFGADTYMRALMRLDDTWRRKHGGRIRTHRRVMARLTAILRRFAEATGEVVYVHAGGIGGRPEGYELGRGEIRLTIWAGHYDFILSCNPATLTIDAQIGPPQEVVHHSVHTVGRLIRSLEADYQHRRAARIAERRAQSMQQAICREVVAVLGEDEFGVGYTVAADSIETTHDFAQRCPEWQDTLGRHFRVLPRVLGLNSSIHALERIAG